MTIRILRFFLLALTMFLAANQQALAGTCSDGSAGFYCNTNTGDAWKCGDNTVQPDCSGHGGYLCNNLTAVTQRQYCDSIVGLGGVYTPSCGNSRIDPEIGESCDNGAANSNTEPDACRESCQVAGCGDSVADSDEPCDEDDFKWGNICQDYDAQGNRVPWASYFWSGYVECDFDCNLDFDECEKCGDGIHQAPYEQCDDGNNINDDGCNNDCTACVQLTNNIDITTDTELCTSVHNVTDYGDEGVIIVKHPDITLDCDGATIMGQGVGAGIYIKMSNNVTIKNCTVTGYAVGIKAVDSQNVNFTGMGNNIYGNTQKLVMENSKLAPPPPMQKVLAGSSMGGQPPPTKLSLPKGQGQSKFQPGGKTQGLAGGKGAGLVKPKGSGLKMPGIQPPPKTTAPGIRSPGTKTPTLGGRSLGTKTGRGTLAKPARGDAAPEPEAPAKETAPEATSKETAPPAATTIKPLIPTIR